MRKWLILLGIVLLLTACGSGGGSRRENTADYRVGSQGLEIRFTDNAPPNRVYAEDSDFPVTVEVRNLGVYPGENDPALEALMFFRGFDTNILTIGEAGGSGEASVTFEPEDAKTRYNPEGGFNQIQASADIDEGYFETRNVDSYDADIVAVVCYPYKTFATIDVCVDPNPNKRNSLLAECEPGAYGGGTQGAPIAITDVETISQQGKVRFTVRITNVGGGDVMREGSISECVNAEIEREELDKIRLDRAELSNGFELECTGSDEITLVNGRDATISCKADGLPEDMPAFRTLLQLELSYGYKKAIQRTVSILGE